MKSSTKRFFVGIVLVPVIGACLMVVFSILRHPARQANRTPVAPARPAGAMTNLAHTAVSGSTKSLNVRATVLPNSRDFRERPFPVAYESASSQWTSADGRDTNVIRQLAHNPLEYDRMVEENSRIFRRQLVYLKETAAAVFEQAKLSAEAVRELTLPGVDGQELQFEIVNSNSKGSSRQGMLSGHLAGNVDSLVTLAFQDGREAFTVLSPKENIFIVGEPREPGQVIVKAINPTTYGMGPAQDAADVIRTGPARQ